MTSAFSAFANEGLRMRPYYVSRITDRGGNVVEETRPAAKDAIRADTAYIMTSLLKGGGGARHRGPGPRVKRPIAGKTGTTNDYTDGWFSSATEPSLAAGVWVGFDEKRESLGRGSDGAHTALPIWMDFWGTVMKDRPVDDYPVPANIVFVPRRRRRPAGQPGRRASTWKPSWRGPSRGRAAWRWRAARERDEPSPGDDAGNLRREAEERFRALVERLGRHHPASTPRARSSTRAGRRSASSASRPRSARAATP
jgi:membrane carboxypeptidase/penicillin-binding protein